MPSTMVNYPLQGVLFPDSSGYAVGASLEQMVDEVRMPTPEDIQQKKTVPVAFFH